MWLFWIVWAYVCAAVSLHLCICMHAHTYSMPVSVCICALVHNFVCVTVLQYQILLSQLSASLSLVVICLSTSQPSAPPSVSLSSFPFSSESLCSASLCWFHFIFFSSLLPCPSSSVGILLPLYPDALSIPPDERFYPPFFFWNTFNLSLHSDWFSSLSHFLKMLLWIFLLAFSFTWKTHDMWKQNVLKHKKVFVMFQVI